MQEWAKEFYHSAAWLACRESYLKKVGGLCEICQKMGIVEPASVVHHRIILKPKNIHDPSVTLNFANLQALCARHHAEVHSGRIRRYQVDEMGHVIARD